MKWLLAWWVAVAALVSVGRTSAQTTWPNAPDTNATLLQDVNFLGSNLANSITATATTFDVTGSSLLGINQEIFIDFEAVKITAINGHTLTVVRGFDNTVPSAHANNARVYRLPGGALHTFVLSAIFALEKTPFQVVSSAPLGACTPNNKMEWVPGGSIYACVFGVWRIVVGGGGSGGGQSVTFAFTNQTLVQVPYNLGTNNVLPTVYTAAGVMVPGGYTFDLQSDGSNATLAFATPQSGEIVVTAASVQEFTETFTNQTSFTVPHNLGSTRPAMAIYNTGGVLFFGSTLTPVDANNSILSFATPQSGTVVLVRQ